MDVCSAAGRFERLGTRKMGDSPIFAFMAGAFFAAPPPRPSPEGENDMQLADVIEKTISGLGYELVDFEASPRGRLLRIYIDLADHVRGVTIEDCEAVSRHLTRLLAVEGYDYDRLEVSSPGMDRPLKKPADFARFAGQEIRVRLHVPVNGQRNFTGLLGGLDDGRLCLDAEGTQLRFELSQIAKARLVPKF
jgi:ribosome maturation factor RimP